MADLDDLLIFAEEPVAVAAAQQHWQVLIVDDEPDVHRVTKLALKGLMIEGRLLAFSHAYSAAEALALLNQPNAFAVALIDVVMEHDAAGLELVKQIRQQAHNAALRIILRTGQPGYAPELETITQYDINDYKTKSELTQVRLFTSLTIAIRSYSQIRRLESGRRRLKHILNASSELNRAASLSAFAQGVLAQLPALFEQELSLLACVLHCEPNQGTEVLAASGPAQRWLGLNLEQIPEAEPKRLMRSVLTRQRSEVEQGLCLYLKGVRGSALVVYLQAPYALESLEQRLIEVFVSNLSAVLESVQLHLEIRALAYHDSLVQLPNRNALVESINRQPPHWNRLALLDLDSFADINSVLDAHFGDAVLQAVARQLHACFGRDCLVVRLGSDLFALHGPESSVTPERISQSFAEPLIIEGQEPLRLSLSVGLLRLEEGQYNGDRALQDASAALKQAKRFARGKALYFDSAQADAMRERIQLLNKLRVAFSAERLFLNYQPFIELASNRVVGAESLLRWRTDEGEFVSPELFIPLAEQSGLMVALGDWVLRTALAWRKSLNGWVDDDFRVAINVSQVQFVEPDFVERLLTHLRELQVPAHQVEIELTESVAIENIEQLIDKLEQLKAQGINVAMDDFGTGYSSLNILQRLPLDRLKIDRSFVSGSSSDASGCGEIAHTIIKLADHLQLTTIAEGIETEQQRAALCEAGCKDGQGYLFSRPLSAEAFSAWLSSR